MEKERFVNPYGFIPLPKKKAVAYEDTDRHTGVIQYTITTKTPLFIPNTSNDDAFQTGVEGHKSYDFFSYNDLKEKKDYSDQYFEPVIPGSELRGMIRNIYETLTDSCMGVFNDEMYPERRVSDVFLPGLIKKTGDTYKLFRANGYPIRGEDREQVNSNIKKYGEGIKLYFEKPEVCYYTKEKPNNNNLPGGYLIKKASNECYILENSTERIQDLDKNILLQFEQALSKNKGSSEYERSYKKFKKKQFGFLPVYYFWLNRNTLKLSDGSVGEKNIPLFPGLIEKSGEQYVLFHAEEYKIQKKDHPICCYVGKKLYFQKPTVKCYSDKIGQENNKHEGYLIKGEAFHQKKSYYIFEETQRVICELNDDAIKRLEAVIASYQSQPKKENSYKEYQQNFEIFQNGRDGFFPVRYSIIKGENTEEKELLYLSPAAITKEIANTPLKKILGKFASCETYQNRCPACDLFGMVGANNEDAIGGKLRFSDAKVTVQRICKDYFEPKMTREVLGSPKLSNPEFYLERPAGAQYWNYDYYVKNGNIYLYTARLRGRKYYFHQPDVVFPKGVEQTNLNATIRPLKSGVEFAGKLFFENISERQLRQLLWILNGGLKEENPKGQALCYKLGSGKPLGFGSVQLQVVQCTERKVSAENGSLSYEQCDYSVEPCSYTENGFSKSVKADFLAISTLDYVKSSEVSYPYVVDQNGKSQRIGTTVVEGFQWFQKNKGNGVAKRVKAEIGATLPSIQNPYLAPLYVETKHKSDAKKGSHSSTKKQGVGYEKDQLYTGVVVGHEEKKLHIQIDGEKKLIKLHIKDVANRRFHFGQLEKECPTGTRIKLTYCGKRDNQYDQWSGEVQ